jgi:hypothetical protein
MLSPSVWGSCGGRPCWAMLEEPFGTLPIDTLGVKALAFSR